MSKGWRLPVNDGGVEAAATAANCSLRVEGGASRGGLEENTLGDHTLVPLEIPSLEEREKK